MLATFKKFAFPTQEIYMDETIRWYRSRAMVKCLGRYQWILPAALRVFYWMTYGAFMGILGVFGCTQKKANMAFPQIQYPTHRIAILPFESSNPYVNGGSLSDWFVVKVIQNMPGVQVIERKDLMKILAEQKLTLTGVIRPDKFSRLGLILGVDAILVGSVETLEVIQSVQGSILVTVKLMEVSTGRILWADRMKVTCSTWSSKEVEEISALLMEKAASKLVGRLGKSPALGQINTAEAETVPLFNEAKLERTDLR